MELGGNTIHKLGKRIRAAYGDGTGLVNDDDLKMLQDYRLSYRDDIASVFQILYDVSKKVDRGCIVTYRVKRINSIIEKLKRFPTAGLENFVDIAGCRCIAENNEKVYKIVKKLREHPRLEVKIIKDYIKTPQPEGYQSIHLYVRSKDTGSKKFVEIQVRSKAQHNWATLVEISDVIIPGSKLKEYGEPRDLLEFHRLLSLPEDSLTDEQRNIYFDILAKYKYIDLMHKVFMQNIALRYEWLNTYSSDAKKFLLIESGVEFKTKIKCFQTFHEAEDAYFERFKQESNANLVLTQIPNVTFEQLSTAYSNYVLSTHSFTTDCINRSAKELRKTLLNSNLRQYKKALDTFLNVSASLLIRLKQEIHELNNTTEFINNPKHREWVKDLQKQVIQINQRRKRLKSVYKGTPIKSGIITRYRFWCASTEISKKYDLRVKNYNPS